ncbi:MAG: nucleotidyltransferase domain-containing protein [bacterium]|nr:nucleotidyltransferase domain-containing protein [bacterium]
MVNPTEPGHRDAQLKMQPLIEISHQKKLIAAICRELGVKRLNVFGSATRADFGTESDIDIAVLFNRAPGQMFKRYFDLKERLERIFGRPVEIVLEDSIRNPYFREAIERTRVTVYES